MAIKKETKTKIQVILTHEEKKYLEPIAHSAQRSMSNYVRMLIREDIKRRGYNLLDEHQ